VVAARARCNDCAALHPLAAAMPAMQPTSAALVMMQCCYRNSVLSIYYTALCRRGALITRTNTLPDYGSNSTGRRK
jgi:hypothetical protein